MKKTYKKIFNQNYFYLNWHFLVGFYLLIRILIGLEYSLILVFVLTLVLLRKNFEESALIFFILSFITYIFNAKTEANHYLSFMYGFLVLSLIKNFYFAVREKFS